MADGLPNKELHRTRHTALRRRAFAFGMSSTEVESGPLVPGVIGTRALADAVRRAVG